MKLFDAAVPVSANGGEVRIEDLASKIEADVVLVGKYRYPRTSREL
jgi:hypothetical protein